MRFARGTELLVSPPSTLENMPRSCVSLDRGVRVGGCTEVLANTLLGVFLWLVLSEVSVSPTLIPGP